MIYDLLVDHWLLDVSRTKVSKKRSPANPRLTYRRVEPGYTPPAAPYRVRGGVLYKIKAWNVIMMNLIPWYAVYFVSNKYMLEMLCILIIWFVLYDQFKIFYKSKCVSYPVVDTWNHVLELKSQWYKQFNSKFQSYVQNLAKGCVIYM